jgi:TctA family transporter
MLDVAWTALLLVLAPANFVYLLAGIGIGLVVGLIPGIGGVAAMAMLIPFTYSMDPVAALAMLVGLTAVKSTSDTIPAVLFGVPGTVGAAATVLDGYPLAKRGEAGRALGASYAASLFGGLFGACVLAVSLPFLLPLILHVGAPELFALSVFGLSSVSALSGGTPLRGIAAAGFGLLIAMIGAAPQLGTLRWTFDSTYLWDGLPLVPVTLGLFAIPELAELAIRRRSIAGPDTGRGTTRGARRGILDVVRHWWLTIRCSALGAFLGAIPGIGVAVTDWVAYGHAARSEKHTEGFGKGDIRGVIASECANNATAGGALVPTIAFGVPGSAGMAILLGAFMIHGLVPGPRMLSEHLDITYALIWSLVIANVIGAGACLLASNVLARIARVRFSILVPTVLPFVIVSAYQASASWGDLLVLLAAGIVGILMKSLQWPRPPLILGFVLAPILERHLHISIERYGAAWLLEPAVVALFIVSAWFLVPPLVRSVRRPDATPTAAAASSRGAVALALLLLAIVGLAMALTGDWPHDDARVPRIVAAMTAAAAVGFVIARLRIGFGTKPSETAPGTPLAKPGIEVVADLRQPAAVLRFTGTIVVFLALIVAVGLIPAIALFVFGYMVLEGRERARCAIVTAASVAFGCWLLFDRWLALPWPDSLIGLAFPGLRAATGLM